MIHPCQWNYQFLLYIAPYINLIIVLTAQFYSSFLIIIERTTEHSDRNNVMEPKVLSSFQRKLACQGIWLSFHQAHLEDALMTNSVLFMSTVGWTSLNAKKWLQNIQHKFFLGSEGTNSPLFHICKKEVSFLSLPIFSESTVEWKWTRCKSRNEITRTECSVCNTFILEPPMGVLCTP